MAMYLRRERRNKFYHDYQLSMSHEIKCLWNYRMKLSIENGYFIRVLFRSVWHGIIENNAMKLSTETGLKALNDKPNDVRRGMMVRDDRLVRDDTQKVGDIFLLSNIKV